jgi:hypothetical protein
MMKKTTLFKMFSMNDTSRIMNFCIYRMIAFTYDPINITISMQIDDDEYERLERFVRLESIRIDRI